MDYSKTALLGFLDFVIDKGLVKAKTAQGWRSAASKLLNDLSEAEETDIRTVDLDLAVHKVANRNPGELSPSTLKDYRNRLGIAVREFTDWKNNPSVYKPRGLNGSNRANGSPQETRSKRQPRPQVKEQTSSEVSTKEVSVTTSGGLPLSYPLRADFLAQVVIPRDLTIEEARRLGAFLMTLAVDFKPE
ncbi:hypothetical protein [Phormidesmis priestleyi]